MKKKYLGILFILLILIIGLILTTGLISTSGDKKNIIGKWKAIDVKNEYYYIFNKDKTCSYEMIVARLDCTYEIKGKELIILYKGNKESNTYEYKFKGNTLIIKDNTGKDNKFSKIN